MLTLINYNHLFDEKILDNLEIIEYENYEEKTIYLEKEAYNHFEMLKYHLLIENIKIDILDGYRSLETQENIFLEYMKQHGLEETEANISMPGTSDHHTSQAIDITIYQDNHWLTPNEMKESKEIFYKIHHSLKHFGFILRYPQNKKQFTHKKYNPYHIRYIGYDHAQKIGDRCLEEYLANTQV